MDRLKLFKLLAFFACLFHEGSASAFLPFTIVSVCKPPASKELISQAQQVVSLEIEQDHAAALKAKVTLLEMIRAARGNDTWDLKLLQREIQSLRTFLALAPEEKKRVYDAMNLTLDYDRHLELNNSPRALQTLHDHITTIEQLCGRNYVQIEHFKYIEASTLAAFDRFEEALAKCQEVEAVSSDISDVMLPEEIHCAFLRSWILHKQGHVTAAAEWYRRAILAHRQLLSDAASRTGLVYDDFLIHSPMIRLMYRARGRYADAAAVSEFQEQAVEAVFGSSSRELAASWVRSAQAFGAAGDFARSTEKALRAVELARRLYSRGDTDYRNLILVAANELFDAGRFAEAKSLFESAESEAQAANDKGDRIRAVIGLSELSSKSGDLQRADVLSAKAIELLERFPEANTEFKSDVWRRRAKVFGELGNSQAAIAIMTTVIDTSKSLDFMAPNGHRNTAILLQERAELRLRNGEIENAKRDLLEALDILDKTVGKEHPQRTQVAARLSTVK